MRIQFDENLAPHKDSFTGAFIRYDLCAKEIRRHRLGCAHAMSNQNFKNILELLSDYSDDFKLFLPKLDSLILRIYQTDHKKGYLDKEFANAILMKNSILQESVRNEIEVVLNEHRIIIKALDKLRNEVIELLNTKI